MIKHYFNGTLILDESNTSKMNYIIEDLSTKEQKSITNILDKIYASEVNKKLIRVSMRLYNNHTDGGNGFGQLYIGRDKFKTEGYFIGSYPLELQLFESVGQNIEIYLEDYTNASAEDGTQYEYKTRIL